MTEDKEVRMKWILTDDYNETMMNYYKTIQLLRSKLND